MIRDRVDFHMHSTASDGSEPPEKLPELADNARLAACAITDHDTIEGVDAFLNAGRNFPDMKCFAGVELSSRYGYRELHIIGLGIDHHNQELRKFLDNMKLERLRRAKIMSERLALCGYPVPDGEWIDHEVVGRMHFARILCKLYDFPDTNAVFEKLLRHGAPGYVPRILPSPAEVIQVIHQAGGAAIWAHPVYANTRERQWAKKVLKHIAPAGLDGMEAYYSAFCEEQTILVKNLAQEFQLILSGGSDFHGSGHKNITVGFGYGNLYVPAEIIQPLEQKLHAIRNGETQPQNGTEHE